MRRKRKPAFRYPTSPAPQFENRLMAEKTLGDGLEGCLRGDDSASNADVGRVKVVGLDRIRSGVVVVQTGALYSIAGTCDVQTVEWRRTLSATRPCRRWSCARRNCRNSTFLLFLSHKAASFGTYSDLPRRSESTTYVRWEKLPPLPPPSTKASMGEPCGFAKPTSGGMDNDSA